MLRVEIDIFSGRPNPVWIISDKTETDRLLGAVGEVSRATAKQGAGFDGLGFREVRVDLIGDDEPKLRRVPQRFALASVAAGDLRASGELARHFIEAMPVRSNVKLVQHDLTPLSGDLRDWILERLADYLKRPPRIRRPKKWPPYNPLRTTVQDETCKSKCEYEVSQFNPGFWNAPNVQPHNNCYNYGRNWRTDTFAQPGRAHGAQTSIMQCNTVTAAAMADGLVKRCNCLPIDEWPRRLMALVVDNQAPGFDYHWYRHQRGGFWGHKPGGTAARNVDNSNAVITSPETCDRGRYNEFCGYFYAGRSVVIN
jgi:hypothetical protein